MRYVPVALLLLACEGPPSGSLPTAQPVAETNGNPAAPPSPSPEAFTGLDGTWVVGGNAAPRVWVVTGEQVVQIDPDGTRHAYSIRAVAPCQLELTSAASGTRTWMSFAVVKDSLYIGSGAIGVPGDDHTVCTNIGVYRLHDAGCTLWTRAPGPGGFSWIARSAVCGLEFAERWFHADDADTERPAGGALSIFRHDGVLMSTAQVLGRAERMADEPSALERAQALRASAGRAEMPSPFPHAFEDWARPWPRRQFSRLEHLWGAAMDREDHWQIGLMFFAGRSGSAIALNSVWPRLTPEPFVHPSEPRVAMEQRTPVMIAEREGVSYGRFARTAWDHLRITVVRDHKERERGINFDSVRALRPGHWELGSPAAYRTASGQWRPLQVVRRDGDTVLGLSDEVLRALPVADVRLIEIGEVFPAGTPVLVLPSAGFGPPAFRPAVVAEVLGDGAGYVVTNEHGEHVLSFEQVMLRDPDQQRVPTLTPSDADHWSM